MKKKNNKTNKNINQIKNIYPHPIETFEIFKKKSDASKKGWATRLKKAKFTQKSMAAKRGWITRKINKNLQNQNNSL